MSLENSIIENIASGQDTSWCQALARDCWSAFEPSTAIERNEPLESESRAESSKSTPFAEVKNVVISRDCGATAIVSGVQPLPGESALDLMKRLHPELSPGRLMAETSKLLLYNREYGNDLGNGEGLADGRTVFLTSVRHYDRNGRISSVTRPDGSKMNFQYMGSGDMVSFMVLDRDGSIERAGEMEADGKWIIRVRGVPEPERSERITIDRFGNIHIDESAQSRKVLLTNGSELELDFSFGKPSSARLSREGEVYLLVGYEYEGKYVMLTMEYPKSGEEAPKYVKKVLPLERVSRDSPGFVLLDYSDNFEEGDTKTRKTRLSNAALSVAERMNRTGRCAEGVQLALADAGMSEFLGSGHAWEMLPVLESSGRFERVSSGQIQAGDLMLRKSAYGSYGHIAVIVGADQSGQLLEASDHQAVVDMHNPAYSQTVFLRLKNS